MKIDFDKLVGMIISLILALIICLSLEVMLGSCTRTVYVPVETVKHDSTITTKIFVDTLMTHDSVYIRERGDTVYYYKWKTEYKYRYATDTMYVSKTDSIAVPYPVEVVKKVIPKWIWYLVGAMAGVILVLVGMLRLVKLRFL